MESTKEAPAVKAIKVIICYIAVFFEYFTRYPVF